MRSILLIILLWCFPFIGKTQVQDNFSDGDFTSNPEWSGEVMKFKVNSTKKLQLDAIGTDTSYLSTKNNKINNTEWRFYIKQSFNSSANNHSRIYLVSNESNLKTSLNGYYVQFGSTQDDICLYRQDGNNSTKIISGTIGNTGNSVNEFTIKVTRDANGLWELFSDASANSNYQSEGSINDITYTSTSYFGLWCKTTSSNSTKVYFDDVYIGAIVVDTVAPVLLSISTIDNHHIDLHFNESLDAASANNNSNYTANNGLGIASNAALDATNTSLVHLSFWDPLIQGQINTLTVNNIADLKGNIAQTQQKDFVFYQVQTYDIVFNEVMADPSPVVGLPEWEYIELFNRSNFPISLNNWTLEIGSTTKTLPDSTISPHGYIIIAHQNASGDLSAYGTFIGLSSFSLTNSAQQLILKNDKGNFIHQIRYDKSWYRDDYKSEGGWSLEQIDPENPCGCSKNWKAANNTKGGTPGQINSVDQDNPDKTSPEADRVVLIDSLTLRLYFTEIMDTSSSLLDTNVYQVSDIGRPTQIIASYPDYQSVFLKFSKPFKTKKVYTLKIQSFSTGLVVSDCAGNYINGFSDLPFGIPEQADSNDVIINEVLFNPPNNGVDYVELYNKSDKILDIKNLRLANWNNDLQIYEHIKVLSEDGFLFFPHSFIVFSTNSLIVQQQYYVTQARQMIQITSMISLPNTEGNVVVLNSALQQIDQFDYNEDMHYDLIQDPKGISLERINYNEPTQKRDNWHSAATEGSINNTHMGNNGTPTRQNSQYSEDPKFAGDFSIEKDIFSPDNDGYNDQLEIIYQFGTSGYTANIRIYNSKGQLVRSLINNELLATEGVIRWDGLTNDNQKANIGIYVIYIEVFNLNGDVKHYKLKTVVAGHI